LLNYFKDLCFIYIVMVNHIWKKIGDDSKFKSQNENIFMLYTLALLNYILFICRFDLDFWEWIIEIGWYSYWNAMYVVMIGMVLTALNSGNCFKSLFFNNFIMEHILMNSDFHSFRDESGNPPAIYCLFRNVASNFT